MSHAISDWTRPDANYSFQRRSTEVTHEFRKSHAIFDWFRPGAYRFSMPIYEGYAVQHAIFDRTRAYHRCSMPMYEGYALPHTIFVDLARRDLRTHDGASH